MICGKKKREARRWVEGREWREWREARKVEEGREGEEWREDEGGEAIALTRWRGREWREAKVEGGGGTTN